MSIQGVSSTLDALRQGGSMDPAAEVTMEVRRVIWVSGSRGSMYKEMRLSYSTKALPFFFFFP